MGVEVAERSRSTLPRHRVTCLHWPSGVARGEASRLDAEEGFEEPDEEDDDEEEEEEEDDEAEVEDIQRGGDLGWESNKRTGRWGCKERRTNVVRA